MKKIISIFLFGLLLLTVTKKCFAQKFSDKNYYLIDSLELEKLTNGDKQLIDSCLKVFYTAKDDTSKVHAIESLIKKCLDGNVWPKYNLWVYSFVEKKLSTHPSSQIKKSLLTTYAIALSNIGYNYSNQGNVPAALEYYHKSLKIHKEIGGKYGIASSLNNIGVIYQLQKDTSTAMDYFKKGLKIYEEIGDKEGIANSLNNVSSIYMDQRNIPAALESIHKSLKLREEVGDKQGIATSLSNIGFIYEKQGDPSVISSKLESLRLGKTKAKEYYLKSLKIQEEIGDKQGIAYSLNDIGEIELEEGVFASAKIHGEKGLQIAQEIGFPDVIMRNADLLSRVAQKQENYKEALKMYKIHIQMRDSLNNEETQKSVIQQEAKYEYEKQKAIDDAAHDKQIAVEKEAKAKQKVITYATAGSLGLVIIFLVFVFNRLQVTKKQKIVIEKQKVEVETQKEVVELAHHELEGKNKEILDSITYAKRIQNAILPPLKVVKEYLQESFILYKPKDIVAGDFYWMESPSPTLPEGKGVSPPSGESEGAIILFAAADCTGHGVPGAMVSVVCNNGLNRSVREFGLTDPGEILNKTREIVIAEFEKSEDEVKDGMDIALCSLKLEDGGWKLKYAGANNPLWIIRKGEIIETKANKQPIGQCDNPEPYTTHTFELQKGDSIYIFSDGYVDQFGGEKGKKFKAQAFRELLLSIQDKSMEEQRIIINEAFENWKGNLEQVDDVCVIGVKS